MSLCHRCNGPSRDWHCEECSEIYRKRRSATPDSMLQYVMEFRMRNPNATKITMPDYWKTALELEMLRPDGNFDLERINRLMGADRRTIMGLHIETIDEETWHTLSGEP